MNNQNKTKEELIAELQELDENYNSLKELYHRTINEGKVEDSKFVKELKWLDYIFEATRTGIDIIDKNYNLHFVDSGWQKVYGNHQGRKCYEYFMGLNEPCENCAIPKALKSKSIIISEELLKKENRIVEVHTIPFQNEDGEWLFGEFNIDINERKKTEQALKESEEKISEIVNQSHDGIIVFNAQKNIEVWNKGAEKMFELKAEDAINKSIVDIQYKFAPLHLKNRQLIESIIDDIINFKKNEIFYRMTDSEVAITPNKNRVFQSTFFPIKISDYHLFGIIFRDTTEIKNYEKELLKLNADKDIFIKVLAHDLKSPFNSILGILNLLLKNFKKSDFETNEKQLKIIQEVSKSTYELLEDILIWGRASSDQIPFEPEHISFEKVCKEVLERLNPIAAAKKISISYFASDIDILYFDNYILSTILRNLISNAIKFTNENGHVNIYAMIENNSIIITVADNGVGINSDVINNLFDISQKISTQGTANERGTGLGLLLCKELLEKNSGKIWVESEFGKGSEFKFSIPFEQ